MSTPNKTIVGKTLLSKEIKYILWGEEHSMELSVGDKVILMEKEVYDELEPHVRRVKKCGHWKEYSIDYCKPIYFLTELKTLTKHAENN